MGLDPFPPRCPSLTSLFPTSFSLSYLVGGLTLSLTNNTGSRVLTKRGTPDWPVRSRELGRQDIPKEKKTPERGERKKRKASPKKKEKATVIRDEPERNLFLECLQSINQPPTATDPPERRRSARHSQSTPSNSTPSPSTRAASPKGKEACQHNQQSTRAPSPKGKEESQHNHQSTGEKSPRKS